MNGTSMTALVSAFARVYHTEQGGGVFSDPVAKTLLGPDYDQVAESMTAGAAFFDPSFHGSREEALRRVVEGYLAPSPLGRAVFGERALENAFRLGACQYLIFGAGYDTFAYRRPAWARGLKVFEIDHPDTAKDKQFRLERAGIKPDENTAFLPLDLSAAGWEGELLKCPGFSSKTVSFCGLMGLCYYLTKEAFRGLIRGISACVPWGSSVVFDYPDEDAFTEKAGERARKQALLANGAGEEMRSGYSYGMMEELLTDAGFLIYEHLTPEEITEQIFGTYNQNTTKPITAMDNVNYCLAVKRKG